MAFASRAFVLYYTLQCLVALNDTVTASDPGDLLRVILARLPGQGAYAAMAG